ncbi:hypothetical protein GCM10010492_39110 [Saccharothrix mutabilis subsp. mutabilis]|uniref:Uncharacterized protein n=1 Tax=Saccharothrix mutabilis subsp. mutabilis TaxID=66855 RepID=A0ABN0U2H9_9PSEU
MLALYLRRAWRHVGRGGVSDGRRVKGELGTGGSRRAGWAQAGWAQAGWAVLGWAVLGWAAVAGGGRGVGCWVGGLLGVRGMFGRVLGCRAGAFALRRAASSSLRQRSAKPEGARIAINSRHRVNIASAVNLDDLRPHE